MIHGAYNVKHALNSFANLCHLSAAISDTIYSDHRYK
jgi:hypothetical protein